MSSPKHERNDVAIAQKAINLARGLSGADKAVAAAILDHFNRKTRQCDPSNERLARLLNIDETTVRRATAALSGHHGLFVKRSHGGKSARASYTPIWSAFRSIVDDWDRRMRSGSGPEGDDENRAEMPGSDQLEPGKIARATGQNCPVEPGKIALQTNLNNQSYEPIPPKAPSECDADTLPRSSLDGPLKGLLNGVVAAARPPGYEARERAATNGCSRSDAAWSGAKSRIDTAIACAPLAWRNDLWLILEPEQMDYAIRCEVRKRGEGMASLDAAIRLARLSAAVEAGNVH